MECALISDESSDADVKTIKDQLSDFGVDDENLSKEEMCDLLKALKNSKSTVKEEHLLRQKVEDTVVPSKEKTLKRRFVNVKDRRMPWSVLPSNLTNTEKARILAVYIKVMSMNSYWQAREKSTFAAWPPPMQIVEESNSRMHSLRSTRSGRTAVPVYIDDDSSDTDFVVAKPKKSKVSGSDSDGVYSNKVISLKRKTTKDENCRPIKEIKLSSEIVKVEASTSNGKAKKDFFTYIED